MCNVKNSEFLGPFGNRFETGLGQFWARRQEIEARADLFDRATDDIE